MQRRAATRSILLVAILILTLIAVPRCATDVPKATIEVEWEKTYAEPDYNNESRSSIQQTSDGGCLIITRTDCSYRSNTHPPGQIACCGYQLTKTDSYGNVQWVRYKTCEWWSILSVQETLDGGYIVTSTDCVGKIDSTGAEQWHKALGYELSYWTPLQQAPDGGYILVSADRVVKIDSTGAEQWQKALDYWLTGPTPFQQTPDGGYLAVSGRTLRKMDAAWNEVWQRTFDSFDAIEDEMVVLQTPDGGCILAGDADCRNNQPGETGLIDFCYAQLTKTDSNGNVEWNTQWLNKSGYPTMYLVRLTPDAGYLLINPQSPTGIRLMKADAAGRQEWEETIGSTRLDDYYSVQQTADEGYTIVGVISSHDYWITVEDDTSTLRVMKVDGDGDVKWDAKLKRSGKITAVAQTSDGGYVAVGHKYDTTEQRVDIWLVKLKCTPP